MIRHLGGGGVLESMSTPARNYAISFLSKQILLSPFCSHSEHWFVRGDVPDGDFEPLPASIYRREERPDGVVRYNFEIKGEYPPVYAIKVIGGWLS